MRTRLAFASLLAVVLLPQCTSSTSPPPPPAARTLVLLHTTDEHSHLLGFGPESADYPPPTVAGMGTIKGGIGRRMTLLASERESARARGAATLTLSAGDNVMGTLVEAATTTSAPDWVAMKALGYDATTFGNHAFDYGPGALASAIDSAQASGGMVPTVMSNVRFSDSDARDDALAAQYDATGSDATKPVHRSLVLTASNGLKVGLVGVMGASAASYAAGKDPVTFSVPPQGDAASRDQVVAQIAADLQPVVDHLRNDEHVDLVIALSHAGLDPTLTPIGGEDVTIAQSVAGIDVVISGHTHQTVPFLQLTNAKTGKPVFLQQAGAYGEQLGRLVVSVDASGAVSADTSTSAVLPIDDRIVPSADATPLVDRALRAVETAPSPGGAPLLEGALARVLGTTVHDDPLVLGDLYFHPVGRSTFDLPGLGLRKETPVLVLGADAMLAAADEYSGGKTDVAVVAAGLVFGDMKRAANGDLPVSEIVRALPLGVSKDGSLGYPLCRFAITMAELKAALEVSAGYAYESADAADYYLVPAGVRYEYDTSRPAFDASKPVWDPANGRVTKIVLAPDHAKPDDFTNVLFDVASGGFAIPANNAIVVATSLYVAHFAASVGVTLRKTDGSFDPFDSPEDAIVHRPDASEVKDWEATAAFVHKLSEAGGTLPARYDAATAGNFPRRAICSGPLCTGAAPAAATGP